MTEIRTVLSVPITDDFKRLSAICCDIGYLSALCDKDIADEMADVIVNYITELFNAKRTIQSISAPPYTPPYVTFTKDSTDPSDLTKISAEWTDADTLVARATTRARTESDNE